MIEQISEELSAAQQQTAELDLQSKQQKVSQLSEQSEALKDKVLADATALKDKAGQAAADAFATIEDDIKALTKKLKSLMGCVESEVEDPDCPDFDVNAVMGKLTAAVQPVVGGLAPITSIVGKVPVVGDLIGSMTQFTAPPATPPPISKEDVKKLVPNKPDIPPSTQKAIDDLIETIQTFCQQLPMTLINVQFMMLGAIFDMFNKIAGIIGVPPMIFPFSLVKSCITLIPKIQLMTMQLPSQIKNIALGMAKDKMAAAQACAIPQAPVAAAEAAGAAQGSGAAAAGQLSSDVVSKSESDAKTAKALTERVNQNKAQIDPAGSQSAISADAELAAMLNALEPDSIAQNAVKQTEKPPANSAIRSAPVVKELPPSAPTVPTIPQVRDAYRPKFEKYEPMCLWRGNFSGYIDPKLSQSAYDCIFGYVYAVEGQLSSDSLHNGRLHADQLEGMLGNLQIMEKIPVYDKDKLRGGQLGPGRIIDPACYKISKNPENPNKFNASCPQQRNYYVFSKKVVDYYRITESSPEFIEWKESVQTRIERLKNSNRRTTAQKCIECLQTNIDTVTKFVKENYLFTMKQLFNLTHLSQYKINFGAMAKLQTD